MIHKLSKDGLAAFAALEPSCLDDPNCEPSASVATILKTYLTEVTHRPRARPELAAAAHRARMLQSGVRLERETPGPVELPIADADIDIEWSYDNRVYLWGFLMTEQGAESAYHPIAAWSSLDHDSEAALAARAWSRLSGEVARCEAAGKRLLVWHYSHPEVSYWRRIIDRSEHPELPTVEEFDEFVAESSIDLNMHSKIHLRGIDGLGLKNVAADGPGFAWRDEDPGGLQSQAWHAESVQVEDPAAAESAQARVLAYNEDDVRATLAVREWLRVSTS